MYIWGVIMNFEKIVSKVVDLIVNFFKQEYDIDYKSTFEKILSEYNIKCINDKYDSRGAFVNLNNKILTLNEFYSKDNETMLANLVHEILHILSNKIDNSNKFVEEGIVQLLTYKILYNVISEDSLEKFYNQDGYRVPVAFMDTVYLIDKNIILEYINSNDGYNKLLSKVSEYPDLVSAITLKNENCTDMCEFEGQRLLEILLKQKLEKSDLICNCVLIDYYANLGKLSELGNNVPNLVRNKSLNNAKCDIEKKKLFELYVNRGYQSLDDIHYDFGDFSNYLKGDIWSYIFDIIDKVDNNDNYNLFNKNINNQMLNFILSFLSNDIKTDIEFDLVKYYGIHDTSLLDFFAKYPKFNIKNLSLDAEGINKVLNLYLKNGLLVEEILNHNNLNYIEIFEKIIDDNYNKYGIVDYNVLYNLFKQYKNICNDYNEYYKLCMEIFKKYNLNESCFMCDPNSIWIENIVVNEDNYISLLELFEKNIFLNNINTNYFLQVISYYVMIEKDKDKISQIISITNSWFDFDDFFSIDNHNLFNNRRNFIHYEFNGIDIFNDSNSIFEKLILLLKETRKNLLSVDNNINKVK